MSSRGPKGRPIDCCRSPPALGWNLLAGRWQGNFESASFRRPPDETKTRNSFSSVREYFAGNVLVLGPPCSPHFEKAGGRRSGAVFITRPRSAASFSQRQRCVLFLQSDGPDRLGEASSGRQAGPLVGRRSAAGSIPL